MKIHQVNEFTTKVPSSFDCSVSVSVYKVVKLYHCEMCRLLQFALVLFCVSVGVI